MRTKTAFWDTSAIIPLCVRQDSTQMARRAGRLYSKRIIWAGTKVEIHSSLSRLKRMDNLDSKSYKVALKQWEKFLEPAHEVAEIGNLLSIAVELPEKYGLRALDAFQLAAALIWCKEKPGHRPFVCADGRLVDAASDAGFDVVELL
jgi:predicted nucleic acid-binding protein